MSRTAGIGRGRRQGSWLTYDVEDGLPSLSVWQVIGDGGGGLWLAAFGGGLCHFDGQTFTTYEVADGLPDNGVTALCRDRHGGIWIGTNGGGLGHLVDGRFTALRAAEGLADDFVYALAEDAVGRLWVGTRSGVSCVDGRTISSYGVAEGLPGARVNALALDGDGCMWLGTAKGIGRFAGDRVAADAGRALAGTYVYALYCDRDGRLWAGTDDKGLWRLDGDRWQVAAATEGVIDDAVRSLHQSRDGRLWVGTVNSGIRCLDESRCRRFGREDGLGSNTVSAIHQDDDGVLWFATEGGLSRYDAETLALFTGAEGLADDGVMALARDRRGQMWFGTWQGVSCWDGTRLSALAAAKGKNVWALLEDQRGGLWFSSTGELGVYRSSESGLETWPLEGVATALCEGGDGRVWIGTTAGLCCLDGGRSSRFTTRDGLVHDYVWALCEDRQGQLWIGTQGGLSRWDGARFVNYTTADGLAHNFAAAICEDGDGGLWIGTQGGGVSRFDGRRFRTYSTKEGLCHNVVLAVFQDSGGTLWFGTYGGGISRYDGRLFQTLSRRHGLPHSAVQDIGQDADGAYWFATEGGVVRYRSGQRPPVVDRVELVADRTYGPREGIAVPDSQKLVLAQFDGRSARTHGADLLYVYRLEGPQRVEGHTRRRRVEFRDLPVGDYCFVVEAVDQDLNYSPPAELHFAVTPDPLLGSLAQALDGGMETSFVGKSAAMDRVQLRLGQIAPTALTVLVTGETGTGKGLAARLLHRLSQRGEGPFIQVNCGALPEGLVESELFGHEKGAFTGAVARKLGKVELAQGGTLFLDEIGDLPLPAQVKLLHFLNDNQFERVGGAQTLSADVRLVAATNRDLQEMVRQGAFREDLFFRLQVFPVEMPPLRQRREDISVLATYFMAQMAAHVDKRVEGIGPQALAAMAAYDWPGNVRELEHAVQRGVIVCQGGLIGAGDLGIKDAAEGEAVAEDTVSLDEHQRRYIAAVIERAGSIRRAARLLEVPVSTLRDRMARLGLRG